MNEDARGDDADHRNDDAHAFREVGGEATEADQPQKRRSVWRIRDYRIWFVGQTCSLIGSEVHGFAFALLTIALTGSVVQAGVIETVASIIALAGLVPAGVIADRWDRRRTIALSSGALIVLYAAMYITYLENALTFWPILLFTLVTSFFGIVTSTAASAAIRSIVPPALLSDAMSAEQARGGAISVLSHPTGALLFSIQHGLTIIVNAVSYLGTFLAALLIRTPLSKPATERSNMFVDAAQGFRILLRDRAVVAIIASCALVNFGSNLAIEGVLFHEIKIGLAPILISLLTIAISVASIVGALMTPWVLRRMRLGVVTILTFVILAVGIALVAVFANQFALIVLAISVCMLVVPMFSSGTISWMFAGIRNEHMGRAQAVLGLTTGGLTAFSGVSAGALLAAFGIVPLEVVAAVITALALVPLFLDRRILRLGLSADESKSRSDSIQTNPGEHL